MLLKELVLIGLEATDEYRVNGKQMTTDMFEQNADKEVTKWYVTIDKEARFGYYVEVGLEE